MNLEKTGLIVGVTGTISGIISIVIAALVIVWSGGGTFAKITNSLDTIAENTVKISEVTTEVATNVRILLDRSNREYLEKQITKLPNPHSPKVCEKMVPDEIKKEIQIILKENKNRPIEYVASIAAARLDLSLIMKIAQEKNKPINLCLEYVAGYVIELFKAPK